MKGHSLFDWISVLGPVLLSWPLVIVIIIALFYRPLFNLLEKASGQEVQNAKIGPFEIEDTEPSYIESLKLLLNSLTSTMEYLEKLNKRDTAPFERNHRLLLTLKQLCRIKFIRSKNDLYQLPEQGDLKNHIELTKKGEKYLVLHDQLAVNEPNN